MKIINILGILLILLISSLGNKIAPGRYCTYYKSDTVRAFGQTQNAENDKHGFWVFLDRWENKQNLSCVMNFENNKRNGWLVEFQGDSLQTKATEIHYLNDTIDGTVKIYNIDGKCNQVLKYNKGEITKRHFLIPEDYWTFEYTNGKPKALDSAFIDNMAAIDGEKIIFFIEDFWNPEPDDQIVVFNSWTNKITAINVAICCILLILNFINLIKHRKNKN